MNDEFHTRPLSFKKDFDQLVAFLIMVFHKEIVGRGMDLEQELKQYKSIMPILRILGFFSKNFKHPLDGFLCFDNDKLIASANISGIYNKWEISMVATHPDYRRKGLARKLVNICIDHAILHDAEMISLEVISDNLPAYKLYKDIGFTHYDTSLEMKFSSDNLSNEISVEFPKEFILDEMNHEKTTYQGRYELHQKCTPSEVQTYFAISKDRFSRSRIKNFLRPIMKKLMNVEINSWIIFKDEKIVASFLIEYAKSGKSTHRLKIVIDPDVAKEISMPILRFTLQKIATSKYNKQNILITVRDSDTYLLNSLEEVGFIEIERLHLLGLKIENR